MDGWVTGWMKEGKKHLFLSKYFLAQGVRVADRWEPVESPASCLRSSPVHVLKEIQDSICRPAHPPASPGHACLPMGLLPHLLTLKWGGRR